MRSARIVLVVLLLASSAVPIASAESLPQVRAMVEAKSSGALAAAEALTKAEPKNASAWTLLTRARMSAGQYAKAVEAGERATALAQNVR